MTRILPVIALALIAVAGGAWYFTQPGGNGVVSPAGAQDSEEALESAELLPERVIGDEDAPVTVEVFSSYTCPHCATFHADQYKNLKADYIDTGKVRYVHHEVYFDRYALWGGMVANCGGDMRYFGISGMLYEQQKDWIGSGEGDEILANLRRIGKTAGLSDDEIDACFADQDMATRLVATYQTNAEAHEIDATPTLVIDGEKHSNMSYDALKEIIEARLAAQ
ncbi:DsbA family protein [Maritimibacter sp. HL-12]|jgi:protein-disulfide isomerase|uniref:DsbA family protein n=1 Tax=Maritimibacter sp. HL-12 TaxID=1162418 RepID=UPI000A0F010A|nr:DsbA family protein [Maritimibacter sp. HL-12]SMH41879.1 Protein-disulfide isomerase [Maritimibacter sp. HL-12]